MSLDSNNEEDIGFLPLWYPYAGSSSPLEHPQQGTIQAFPTYPGFVPPPPPPLFQSLHGANMDGTVADTAVTGQTLPFYDDVGYDPEENFDMTEDSKFYICHLRVRLISNTMILRFTLPNG